jgi:hypothetical protein
MKLRHVFARTAGATAVLFFCVASPTSASDHLDTPTVIADPAADIGDIYAWMSPDGRRLNLVMDIVGHQFSDRLQYVFHVDSGPRFGVTDATIAVTCRFDIQGQASCHGGNVDPRRLRVFAGVRDDPFFNNVKGTRAALNAASAALHAGVKTDAAGCPAFDVATSRTILDQWRRTEGGPAKNMLAGWKTAALVISVDLDVVNRGGRLLAVWGAVHNTAGQQIERVGRPLTGNGLIGPLAPGDASDRRKEAYNRADQRSWPQFTPDLAQTLALYDGFDGTCGNQWNQWFADRKPEASKRYEVLAKILADDRLWVNSGSASCKQFLAVEMTELSDPLQTTSDSPSADCGGRTPDYDAVDVFRSLLVGGLTSGVTDGVDEDDRVHSTSEFPFLAQP